MKPLPAKRRNLFLIGALIVFFVFAPFLVFTSMGYKLDYNSLKGIHSNASSTFSIFTSFFSIEKTGGLYVRSDLFGLNVFVNDEEFTDRGIFSRNILVQDLKPGTYDIRIEKDGYRTWAKQIDVSPNKVTETYLFTLPIELIFTEVPQFLDTDGMATTTNPTSTSKKMTSFTTVTTNPGYKEVVALFAAATSTMKSKVESATIAQKNKSISSTSPTSSAQTLLAQRLDKPIWKDLYATITATGTILLSWDGSYDHTPYYFCVFEICHPEVSVVLPMPVKKFYLFPGRNDILIVEIPTGIYYVDISTLGSRIFEPIYEKNGAKFIVVENQIFIKDGARVLLMSY